MKDVDKAIQKYIEKFGGYPYFMLMGADDDYVIRLINKSLKTGKEIEIEADPGDDY